MARVLKDDNFVSGIIVTGSATGADVIVEGDETLKTMNITIVDIKTAAGQSAIDDTLDAVKVAAQGTVAHSAADANNPLKIGYKAIDFGANPTAVDANERTDAYANRAGIPWVLGGHPNIITESEQITDADGAQTNTALVTVGASVTIVVTKCSVTADNANTVDVSCRIGFGTTTTPAADATGVILYHPGIAAGSGVIEGNGAGIIGIGAANEDLRVTCEDPATGSISIIVTYFTTAI